MRASLASATSLLALLLLEAHEANAGPVVTSSNQSLSFGNVLVGQSGTAQSDTWTISGQSTGDVFSISSASSPFSGTGSNGTVGTATATASVTYNFAPAARGAASNTITGYDATTSGTKAYLTLTGTGVAPVQSVANSTVYGRFGSGSVSNGTITVANVGDGNLAGTGTAYNLNGSVSAFSSGSFSGTAASISLASNATASTSSTATSTLSYTYTPGATRATSSTTVSIAFSNGNSSGNNLSQSVAATLTGQAVGPTYASTLVGKSVANTPGSYGTGTVAGAAGATINFGTVSYKNATTIYLELANTTTDANGGNALLTDLSVDKYSISGASATSFAAPSSGSVITEGGMLLVPITVTSQTAYGSLNSSLTIFTDVGAAYGGYGENFTYALTALSVPEPTSLAVVGAGLAGLACFGRRKRVS